MLLLPPLTCRIGFEEEDGGAETLSPPLTVEPAPATTDSLPPPAPPSPPFPFSCRLLLLEVRLRPSTVAERIRSPPAPAPPEPPLFPFAFPPPEDAGNSLGTKQLRSRNSSTMRLSGGTSSIRRSFDGGGAGFSTSFVVAAVAAAPPPPPPLPPSSSSSMSARQSTVKFLRGDVPALLAAPVSKLARAAV